VLKLESCVVDLQRRLAHRPDDRVEPLTEQEAALLTFLAARPGEVVTREELLRGVMGYAGATVTRALDAAMSRLRQKVERDSAVPAHLLTVRGVGYRFAPLADRPPTDGEPRLPFPAELDAFVGRAAEVEAIVAAVTSGPGLTTVLGGPGSGRTRTAIHVGHALVAGGEAAAFAALGGATTADEAAAAVAAALGAGRGDGPAAERVARVLALRDVVVVLDDVDADRPEVVGAVAAWRSASPGARWVVTSSAPLRLPGERRHPLGPLPDDEAAALLRVRADAVRPGWGGQAEAAADLARLARVLEGNPLALELAAGRAVVLSPAELADTLEQQGLSLLGGLRAAIRGAWDHLGPVEQRLLARCAVFPAPFSADDAAALHPGVVVGGPHPGGTVLDPLQGLVERSVLRCRQAAGGTRFEMDDSVRRFAGEQLEALEGPGEAEAVRRRARDHALERGEACVGALVTARSDAAIDELRERLPHLQRALDEFVVRPAPHGRAQFRRDDADLALRAALVLSAALELHGTPVDRLAALDAALGDSARADRALRIRGLLARGQAHRELATGLARADVEAAMALLRDGDPPALAARAWLSLATLEADAGALDAAQVTLDRAAGLGAGATDTDLHVRLALLAGRVALERGDVDAAERSFRAVDAIGRACGARRILLLARMRLGLVARERDQLDDAEQAFTEALALARGSGPVDEAVVHGNLVGLQLIRGDLDAAAVSAERALTLYRRTAALNLEAGALTRLAAVRMAQGELEGARRMFEEAVALAETRGDPRDLALAAGNLGQCLHWLDRPAEARPMLTRAIEVLPPSLVRGYFEAQLGAVAAALHDVPAATEAIEQAAVALAGTAGEVLLTVLQGLVALARARAAAAAEGDPEVHLARARACLEAGRRGRSAGPVRTTVMMVMPTEVDAAIARLEREIERVRRRPQDL
jgi:tetratricopeptide (TPR) repeat protein